MFQMQMFGIKKENSDKQFYAKWEADSSYYKDDLVEIFYK